MFTDTQLDIYESSKEFIFTRLNNVLNRSKEDSSSLKALFYQLKATIEYNKEYTEQMGEIFYSSYPNIKLFFSKLHDFLHGNDPDHKFITSLSDPRFFSQQNDPVAYKEELVNEFGSRLKMDIKQWYSDEFKKTQLTEADMTTLHTRYPVPHQSPRNSFSSSGLGI